MQSPAGDISAIPMGAIPVDPQDFCTYLEEMVAAIDELYWDKNIVFNMSRQLRKRYREGRRQKYNLQYAQISDLDVVQDFENFSVKGYASHEREKPDLGYADRKCSVPCKRFL
jgi:hypothetical protein